MQKTEFTDQELMAYADGELAEDRASELDQALAEDAGLSERLALFIDTRTIAQEAFEPMLQQPVPDHLVQHVRALEAAQKQSTPAVHDTVVSFPTRQTPQPVQSPVWKLPLAASLALAVGLGTGLMFSPADGTSVGIEIATLTDARIIAALDAVPSGEDVLLDTGERIAPIATFFDGEQTLCREFELDRADGVTIVSVACQRTGQWDVQLAIAAAGATDTGYAPASSLEALDAYLSASSAGDPLDPAAEAAALAALR